MAEDPKQVKVLLPDAEDTLGAVVDLDRLRKMAQITSLNADTMLRVGMTLAVAGIFIWLNYEVMQVVWQAWGSDVAMLVNKQITPADRLITPSVIMALIGATVVQVGVGTLAIVSYLFPKVASGDGHT